MTTNTPTAGQSTSTSSNPNVQHAPKPKQTVPPRDRYQRQSLGTLYTHLKETRVLLVGAGGIGCELLKNLVKSGFGEIHIIDLDTIDLSNLNRQFLFRQDHIKKSKAIVAKEVAQKFNPDTKLVAHHANIKDEEYTVDWFAGFTLVFNALDNLDARRHVNRMCLAADVPLIESGTTGFNGNVQVIKKGRTACYECKEKQIPKSFPVCTVRSTPSQPIHTVVWAKSYLLPELFGNSEDSATDFDTSVDSENAAEIEKLKEESQQLKKLRDSMESEDFAAKVFEQVFKTDIERLLGMEAYWKGKGKKPPQPYDYDTLATGSENIDPSISKTDQRVWNVVETFVVFKDALSRLSKRLISDRANANAASSTEPVIEFDKDDEDTLDFVTAAANLWSGAFGITPISKFDTKQMAGNIIPAIATTNAMVAALCVLQSYKVIRGDYDRTRELFLQKANMVGDASDLPNPECVICSRAMARIKANLEKATVQDLVELLRKELDYGSEFNVNIDAPQIIVYDYMEAEDDEEAAAKRLQMKLADEPFNIRPGTSLVVQDDEGQRPRVDLQLFVERMTPVEDDNLVIQIVTKDHQKLDIPHRDRKPVLEVNGATTMATDNDSATTGVKRKRDVEDEGEMERSVKRKTNVTNGETVILDDDDDSVIDTNTNLTSYAQGEGVIEID